jgi:hypothetical protein
MKSWEKDRKDRLKKEGRWIKGRQKEWKKGCI